MNDYTGNENSIRPSHRGRRAAWYVAAGAAGLLAMGAAAKAVSNYLSDLSDRRGTYLERTDEGLECGVRDSDGIKSARILMNGKEIRDVMKPGSVLSLLSELPIPRNAKRTEMVKVYGSIPDADLELAVEDFDGEKRTVSLGAGETSSR